jgi:putative restriction endonuclease
MDKQEKWLKTMANLNLYKAKHGTAPHKPLLLLVVIDLVESGELSTEVLELTPRLAFRFSTYARVVAYRRTQPLIVRYPFYHLKTDGFWTALDERMHQTKERERVHFAVLQREFYDLLHDQQFRYRTRILLISTYFQATERAALYALANLPAPDDDEIAEQIDFESMKDAERRGREARFRINILYNYDFVCSLTGYRLTTIESETVVDAAHIHQFSDSRNNDPRNGLALCKNAHWLFDNGLWTLSDEYHVIVARGHFDEECFEPGIKKLVDYHGQRIHLPKNESVWPDPKNLKWHRDNRFKGG